MHKPIRNMSKRFQIVLYHLEKICEDWGECAGISASDATNIQIGPLAELRRLFEARKFWAFQDYPFISEEEFDNEPQATTMLEEDNKRLRARVSVLETIVDGIRNNLNREDESDG